MDDEKVISTKELVDLINNYEGDFIISIDLNGGEENGNAESLQT